MPIITASNFEVEITLNGDRVEHLFNDAGSETFDVTEAMEASVEGAMVQLSFGDVINIIAVKE